MSESANAEKEADHHPYRRPVDAATLILVDRSGATPKVLVGKRHEKVVFMPGKIVFPGGRVDAADSRIPVAEPIPAALEANLLKGRPKITPSRARALAIAAVRETCEETGLCLGRKHSPASPALSGSWQPFADAGLLPDPSSLFLITRAITPPWKWKNGTSASWRKGPAARRLSSSPSTFLVIGCRSASGFDPSSTQTSSTSSASAWITPST